MALTSNKNIRGGYDNIGNAMNVFDDSKTSTQKHEEELARIIAERDAIAQELAAAKRKEKSKVKLQVYIDSDINDILDKNAQSYSRKNGGKSAYLNSLLRKSLGLDD